MSIEQKIAEMLAESKAAAQFEEENLDEEVEGLEEESDMKDPSDGCEENPDSKRNNVDKQEIGGKSKVANVVTKGASTPEESHLEGMKSVKEDVEALVNGEDLSEEFKQKAATIFEAAVVTRVKQEVARLEEEFQAQLDEAVAEEYEGLVEKVDGYLNYIVESWIAQNEIALERGMKSEILENFVSGLKSLFQENYIDVPEEKYDLIGDMEQTIIDLQDKLNEQLEANVEMFNIISESKRIEIIKDACDGLTDTEVEKFTALAEELSYEDSDSFATKVQTIRENYFTNKVSNNVIVESIVTDEPVTLNEEVYVEPKMRSYLSALNTLK